MDINGNHMLWTELSSPQIPTLKLHPPLWLLEDSIFKEATEVKWGHKGGALNQQDQCPGKQKRQQGCDHNREKAMWGHSEKAATKGPREKPALPTPWLDFQPLGPWVISSWRLNSPARGILLWQP